MRVDSIQKNLWLITQMQIWKNSREGKSDGVRAPLPTAPKKEFKQKGNTR